jgi:tetratricopeptide (TPR) repeat protein
LKELKQFEEAVENLETICYKLMEDYKLYSPKREVPDFDKEQPAQLEQVESILEKKVLDLEEKGDKMVEKVIESYTACQEICLEINKQNSQNKVLHYAKKVLVLDSKNVKAMCMQAMALKELKKFEEAVQNLEPIYNILMEDYKLCSPKREVLGVDKEQPAQVKQVESILEKKVRNLKEEGEKMVEEDIEYYIEYQKTCLEINTQDSQNKVIIYGNKVLNLDSKNVKAMCMQAMALKALKKFEEAVQNLEPIYYILMEDYKLCGPKREVLGVDKEQPEKVEQYERIIEEVLDLEEEEGKKMVNEAIESYIACQKICFKINKQDSQEKVISYGNKVLDLDSNNVTAWCMQAMAFKVLGEFEDAVQKLEISYKSMEK